MKLAQSQGRAVLSPCLLFTQDTNMAVFWATSPQLPSPAKASQLVHTAR